MASKPNGYILYEGPSAIDASRAAILSRGAHIGAYHMTTYTVIDTGSGEVIATGLTAADASSEVLTSDSREFDVRPAADGNGFELWTRQQVANKGWTRTVVYSIEDDRTAAETEIFAKVIAANWSRHPTVLTDVQYAAMQT